MRVSFSIGRIALACALFAASVLAPRPSCAHGPEMLLGSTRDAAGALGLEYDFTAPVVVSADVSFGGMTLYTGILPGIEWLQADLASPPLYALPVGTPFSMRIVSIDPNASIMIGGTSLTKAGDSAFVASTTNVEGDHYHPQWQLVLPDGVTGEYPVSFQITTTAAAFSASAVYTLAITNIAEPTATVTEAGVPTETPSPTVSPTPPASATVTSVPSTATETPLPASTPTATDTSAASPTGPPTATPPPPSTPTPPAVATDTPTPTPTDVVCPGDCDGNGVVTVDELVAAVNVALGAQPPNLCAAADLDGSATVSVDELVSAVRAALEGCPSSPA